MFKLIKDFLIFRKIVNSYPLIELNEKDKVTLEAMDKELIKKISHNSIDLLIRDMLKKDLSEEYVRWYKQWIVSFLSYFRIYK